MEDTRKWQDVIFGLLRHPAYCLINIALTVNISRWALVISESNCFLRGRQISQSESQNHKDVLIAVIVAQVAFCLVWTIM